MYLIIYATSGIKLFFFFKKLKRFAIVRVCSFWDSFIIVIATTLFVAGLGWFVSWPIHYNREDKLNGKMLVIF